MQANMWSFFLFVFCSLSFTFFFFVLCASSTIEMLSVYVNDGAGLILKYPVILQLLYLFQREVDIWWFDCLKIFKPHWYIKMRWERCCFHWENQSFTTQHICVSELFMFGVRWAQFSEVVHGDCHLWPWIVGPVCKCQQRW